MMKLQGNCIGMRGIMKEKEAPNRVHENVRALKLRIKEKVKKKRGKKH